MVSILKNLVRPPCWCSCSIGMGFQGMAILSLPLSWLFGLLVVWYAENKVWAPFTEDRASISRAYAVPYRHPNMKRVIATICIIWPESEGYIAACIEQHLYCVEEVLYVVKLWKTFSPFRKRVSPSVMCLLGDVLEGHMPFECVLLPMSVMPRKGYHVVRKRQTTGNPSTSSVLAGFVILVSFIVKAVN